MKSFRSGREIRSDWRGAKRRAQGGSTLIPCSIDEPDKRETKVLAPAE